jgi:hypothetical protein
MRNSDEALGFRHVRTIFERDSKQGSRECTSLFPFEQALDEVADETIFMKSLTFGSTSSTKLKHG